jgi:hypothetical protein
MDFSVFSMENTRPQGRWGHTDENGRPGNGWAHSKTKQTSGFREILGGRNTDVSDEIFHFPLFLTLCPHHFTTVAGLVLGW